MTALTGQTRVLVAVCGLLILGVVLEFVRRRKLQERYTILWIVAGLGFITVGAFPGIINVATNLLGVRNSFAGVVGLVILMLFCFALHFSTVISRLSEQVTRLAQELAVEKARSAAKDQTDNL